MKRLVDSIKESVFDPIKTYSDILTPEELDYKFKSLIFPSGRVVKDIIIKNVKDYQKDPDESAKQLKKDIVIDKLLVSNGFNQDNRITLSNGNSKYGPLYHLKSKVNPKGYCAVFDPYDHAYHNWNFLVTKATSSVGKTLKPIEWVEPKDNEEKNHQYDEFNGIERTYFDDPIEAWKYIEKKYGRF